MATNLSFGQPFSIGKYYLYEDSTKNLTPEKAVLLFKQGKFNNTIHTEINIGFTRSVFWLAFKNDHQLPSDSLLLYVGHHHINRIHFFYASQSNIQQQWITGDYFPFSQRPVNATGFYFPINNAGLYLARIDKVNESLQLSFKLISKYEAFTKESNNKTIMAIFTGMVLLLIIFGTYLFVISKRIVYLYYVLYITAGWLWVLANAGYGFQYMWPRLPWFASKARPFFVATTFIFSLLFLIRFIGGEISKKILITVKILNGLMVACIIAILFFNPGVNHQNWWLYCQYLIPVIALAYAVLSFSILISQSVKGNRQAMFYLFAMMILITFVIFQMSFWVGGINKADNFFSNFGLSVGYIIEAILLTAGLAYSFNQYRIDKEKLLISINIQQQNNTRIMMEVQEEERNQIANQLHDVVGSLLSAAKLNLSSLLEKKAIINEQALNQAIYAEKAVSIVSEMVRNLSHALSPVMLKQVGFKTTIEKVVAIFNASGKINITLLIIGFEQYKPALNNYYIALYSMVYELLNNIIKHSNAPNAMLQVIEYNDCFSLIAEDDGIGIDANKKYNSSTLGMAAIHSKISFLGGKIAIDNLQPSGLLVTIEIPIIDKP